MQRRCPCCNSLAQLLQQSRRRRRGKRCTHLCCQGLQHCCTCLRYTVPPPRRLQCSRIQLRTEGIPLRCFRSGSCQLHTAHRSPALQAAARFPGCMVSGRQTQQGTMSRRGTHCTRCCCGVLAHCHMFPPYTATLLPQPPHSSCLVCIGHRRMPLTSTGRYQLGSQHTEQDRSRRQTCQHCTAWVGCDHPDTNLQQGTSHSRPDRGR